MAEFLFNAIGFFGLGLFLLSYAMINLGKWHAGDWKTHLPNLLGALCIIVSLMNHWNLPVFILELCWGAISVYGLWRSRATKGVIGP
jgi:hypothetical protein